MTTTQNNNGAAPAQAAIHGAGEMLVTEHNAREWSRMAQAAYASGRNAIGHRFSAAATTAGERIALSHWDKLQEEYREWLVFGFPKA